MTKKMLDLMKFTSEDWQRFRDRYDAYFFDMDGCLVVLGGNPLPGVGEALDALVRNGKMVGVLTDNCLDTLENISSRINRLFPCIKTEHVMSCGYLMAKYLKEINFNEKIYAIGHEDGVIKEMKKMGFEVIHDTEVQKLNVGDLRNVSFEEGVGAVVIGADFNMNYLKMVKAVNYLTDPRVLLLQTHYPLICYVKPTILAVGTTVVAIKAASGRKESICSGKGSEYSAKYLKSLGYPMERCLFIGDGLENDIQHGNVCGMDTLLVLSGTTCLNDVEKAMAENKEMFIPTYYTNSVADLINLFKSKS